MKRQSPEPNLNLRTVGPNGPAESNSARGRPCGGQASLILAAVFIALLLPARLGACGPDFPNWMLGGGDAILAAPLARFEEEIARLKVPPPPYLARLTGGDSSQDTVDSELVDLRTALAQSGVAGEKIESVVAAHAIERRKLAAFVAAMNAWRASETTLAASGNPPPDAPEVLVASSLPTEFSDYFRGCVAWYRGETNTSRAAWSALLARPREQRRFKSTWSAYMLGRSWEDENPARAIRFYQQVRALVDEGFADSSGLAVASIGREARLCYLRGDYQRAIELYLQQHAAGDNAGTSLRWVAATALQAGPSVLRSLARDPTSRRVITAYVISGGFRDPDADVDGPIGELIARGMEKVKVFSAPPAGWHKRKPPALLWLEAMENAGVRDVLEAERFALAAYQAGLFEQAARWLDRAPLTPAARWLRAKLLLRDGKVNEAAAMLAAVARQLKSEPGSGDAVPREFAASLVFPAGDPGYAETNPELAGELGALRLARREYTEALDALLRSGYWMDTAYVAERVLTLDELKTYVERHWPEPPAAFSAADDDPPASGMRQLDFRTPSPAADIRHLLARRLLRLDRVEEARPLFPPELRPLLDELQTNRLAGVDPHCSRESRGAALWRAAQVLRNHGMELIGTEVEPDWRIHGGDFEVGVNLASRASSTPLRATAEELQRAQAHGVDPEERFHYRYVAAKLAWEAAQLLPDNTDETARVLCIAGSWLKGRDPQAADVFYKALVRRCRRTAIGAEADRKRWFPSLDETGNLRTNRPPARLPAEQQVN